MSVLSLRFCCKALKQRHPKNSTADQSYLLVAQIIAMTMNYDRSSYLLFLALCTLLAACTYTERIKDGSTAYQRKQYNVAIPMLQKEFGKADDSRTKGQTAYMLAESYRKTNQPQAAADWYKRAQTQRYGADTDLKYARMLQQLEQYDEAKKAYRAAGRYAGNARLYQEEMIACDLAERWLNQAKDNPYKVESLPQNTADNDFSPVLYNDNKLIVSSDRAQNKGKDKYKWTGAPFFDLYEWDLTTKTVQPFDAPFNDAYHQGTLSFNEDQTIVLFTECGSSQKVAVEYCRIMISQKENGTWSKPEVVDLGNAENNYLHPALSPDGRFLIFASDKNGGFGGYDLYFANRLGNDDEARWSKPVNMGSRINTKRNEVSPFVLGESGEVLYFASNGHLGMGGLDLFRVEQRGERWQYPTNLEAPMNSGGDDFGLVIQSVDTSGNINGFFSTNRLSTKGGDDVYRFSYAPPIPDTTVDVTPILTIRIDLEGIVKEKIFNTPNDPNSGVASLAPMLGASVQISTLDTAFTLGSDIDGTFYATLDTGQVYYFNVTKPNYYVTLDTLSTQGIILNETTPDTTLSIELVMEKIFTNHEVVLENIYYDLDKAFIREDAKPTLNQLIETLKRNPTLNIQLNSHTDCQGGDGYNEKLSQRRAEAAVQYLIQNGINPARLTAKGFGESKLANPCKCSECTPEEHQENRRTTFLVLE